MCLASRRPCLIDLCWCLAAALSKDGRVKVEAMVDPLMVKGCIRNKTAYEIIKMIQAVREIAHKVRQLAN